MSGLALARGWWTMLVAGALLSPRKAAAAVVGEEKAGIIVWIFLGVCALIALRQLWPAIRLGGTVGKKFPAGKNRDRKALKRDG